MEVKEMLAEMERMGLSALDMSEKERYASVINTRWEGCRKVRPMCLPVEYKRRHLPGKR